MRPILIGLSILALGFSPALVGASLASPPAHAGKSDDQDRGKDHGKDREKDHGKDRGKDDRGKDERGKGGESRNADSTTERVLTAVERAILGDYFGTRDRDGSQKSLPPGLAKRDSLPPGLAKQLERNGRLPPGLEGRALPDDLERRLPRRPGTKRVIIDNDVVLIEEGTRVILDILRGAAGG